ncbi:MAG TPA: TonB C-terminal domain-containing protein [Candidatus Omnitrophota bacterium]|nr:TonB C-terminal domain-containing protein [Candidatus Omnitrophota bacterium]
MSYKTVFILIISVWLVMSCAMAYASSEGLCVKKDVVLYSITLKDPPPDAFKEGLSIQGSVQDTVESSVKTVPQGVSKAYADYYKKIRNKIKDRLVSRYHQGLEDGDINLVFILTSAGKLESVNISEIGSAKDSGLRDFTVKGIKDSAPFPPFPRSLDKAKMTFDLSVSFRKN